MTERRYGDEEVREIFSLATTGDLREQSLPADTEGLTLSELQRIGQEAGIEPARVAHAAASLDARGKVAPVRRSFGMPIGVSRVVDLPRAPKDREWERLVSEFRSTFGTQGRTTSAGGLREWSQGNLRICVEPTEHGEQLRLSTLKGNASVLNRLSLVFGSMSVVMGTMVATGATPAKALVQVGMFGGMALLAFGANLIRLPRWARKRDQQMEAIAEHAVRLLSNP
ncbi:MAG TPA: hypothetical protein VF461_00010 [Gemmatimonadaceae bacterium]